VCGGFNKLATNSAGLLSNYVEIIVLLLPHSILEIPAYIIASAVGFSIAYKIIQYLRGKRKQIHSNKEKQKILYLTILGYFSLVLSIFIESNITIEIYNMIFG
jgi:stage II sporulation protein M